MDGCVTVIYHFPEGFARWRRMLDSPALNELSFRVVQYLMVEQPSKLNAEALAARFGTGRTRMYRSLRELETWGYLRRKRTSSGYGKFAHFWQVSDEPFTFPAWPDHAVCHDSRITTHQYQQVKSCDSLRQPKEGTEPDSSSLGPKDKTRAVDRRHHGVRRSRTPRGFDLARLPEADQPHAAAALALLEGLCVVPGQRIALTPPLAAAIGAGWPVGALGHYLTQGMGTARNRFRVMLYRLAHIPSFEEITAGDVTGARKGMS